jgi:hypothetical protein
MSSTFLSEETARYYEDMWIADQMKRLSDGKYWFLRKGKNEWRSIIADENWDKIYFHFEIRWSDGKPISQTTKINIRAHLESKFIDEELDRKARVFFEEQGCVISSNTIKKVCGITLKEYVVPDFSNEETAIQTIMNIIAVLDSAGYQKCAEIADAFLKQQNLNS